MSTAEFEHLWHSLGELVLQVTEGLESLDISDEDRNVAVVAVFDAVTSRYPEFLAQLVERQDASEAWKY